MALQGIEKLSGWPLRKALYLAEFAADIEMTLEDCYVGENPWSGNVYLASEYYNFCLYMPINCDLTPADVEAVWSNPETGEEVEFDMLIESRADLENWTEKLRESELGE
jgi:hypothetical protein